jgi:hypothetical protein
MAVSEDICSYIAIGKCHRPARRYVNINMLMGCENVDRSPFLSMSVTERHLWKSNVVQSTFCMYFVVTIYQQPLSQCPALVVFMKRAFRFLYRNHYVCGPMG